MLVAQRPNGNPVDNRKQAPYDPSKGPIETPIGRDATPGIATSGTFGMGGKPGSPYYGDQILAPEYSSTPGILSNPGYIQSYNPNTMSMGGAYDAKQAEINKLGFNQFKDAALRQGPSAWATLANKQTQDQTNVARDQARASGAGVAAQTEAGLASNGGLSGGARERAQEGGAKSIMSMDQNLQRQGLQNASQIATNDEQQKMQMMSQLPGMAQQQLGAWQGVQQQDLANQISENQSQQAFNKWLAEEQNKQNAATASGQAIRNS